VEGLNAKAVELMRAGKREAALRQLDVAKHAVEHEGVRCAADVCTVSEPADKRSVGPLTRRVLVRWTGHSLCSSGHDGGAPAVESARATTRLSLCDLTDGLCLRFSAALPPTASSVLIWGHVHQCTMSCVSRRTST
jgi:hypothetical protein